MKVKLMLIGILMTGIISHAQKTSLGLRGGVNFYNITGKDMNGDKLENKLKTGFNLGLNADIPIGIDFYVQPGAIFSTKGSAKINGTENNITLTYIEVPVNLLYKPELGSGKLLLGFGPYVAFGVGGKLKFDNGNDDLPVKFQNKVSLAELIAGENLYYKGLDAGANLLFGYEWVNGFSAQLNAGLGLVDITPEIENSTNGKTKGKNTGFGISLGYRFSK
jgi:hypothetical protein